MRSIYLYAIASTRVSSNSAANHQQRPSGSRASASSPAAAAIPSLPASRRTSLSPISVSVSICVAVTVTVTVAISAISISIPVVISPITVSVPVAIAVSVPVTITVTVTVPITVPISISIPVPISVSRPLSPVPIAIIAPVRTTTARPAPSSFVAPFVASLIVDTRNRQALFARVLLRRKVRLGLLFAFPDLFHLALLELLARQRRGANPRAGAAPPLARPVLGVRVVPLSAAIAVAVPIATAGASRRPNSSRVVVVVAICHCTSAVARPAAITAAFPPCARAAVIAPIASRARARARAIPPAVVSSVSRPASVAYGRPCAGATAVSAARTASIRPFIPCP